MFSAVVVILLILSALVQIGYIEYFLAGENEDSDTGGREHGLADDHRESSSYAGHKVSVIICAHNEAQHLAAYLPQVLNQHYHDVEHRVAYEVIVVNDRSTDDTARLLEEISKTSGHLKVVTIGADDPRQFPGKKNALSRGVAAASHEIILMTDADCRPAGPQWIRHMAHPFSAGLDIVGGYGGFEPAPGILNGFVRCETIHTFAQYAGYNGRGRPYMAVGRNLACRKTLLLRAQQDPIWSMTASGDDDMLIRICADRHNMAVIHHPESHTWSIAKNTWREYLLQKQRHVSTGKYYRPSIKRLLGGYAFFHALYWICLVIYLLQLAFLRVRFDGVMMWLNIGGIAVIMRCLLFSKQLHGLGVRLSPDNRRLRYFWPIFDLGWMVYNIVLSPYILWKSKQRWK